MIYEIETIVSRLCRLWTVVSSPYLGLWRKFLLGTLAQGPITAKGRGRSCAFADFEFQMSVVIFKCLCALNACLIFKCLFWTVITQSFTSGPTIPIKKYI
jgi:hypothetical protein